MLSPVFSVRTTAVRYCVRNSIIPVVWLYTAATSMPRPLHVIFVHSVSESPARVNDTTSVASERPKLYVYDKSHAFSV